MTKILILIMLISPLAWAGQKELDTGVAQAERIGIVLTAKDQTDLLGKGWRSRRAGEFRPITSSIVKPADYENENHRGTVEYSEKWRNYSLHKVKIPNGATVRGLNLVQRFPNTEAIVRAPGYGHNITFVDCNMVNVKTYDDSTLKNSHDVQVFYKREGTEETGFRLEPIHVAKTSKEVPENLIIPAGVER